MRKQLAFLLAVALAPVAARAADVTRAFPFPPGSPAETQVLIADAGSTVADGARRADVSGGWSYRFVAPPGSHVALSFSADGQPAVTAGVDGGEALVTRDQTQGDTRTVEVDVPATLLVGSAVRFRFQPAGAPIAVRDVRLTVTMPDANGDRIPDVAERLMGLPQGKYSDVTPRPAQPTTTFQTGRAYSTDLAPPTDAVLVYSSNADTFHTWADTGFALQCMGGFRDGPDYAKQHPEDVQTDRDRHQIVIGGSSYYLVPSARRSEIERQYYDDAIAAGATAICPEEPEFWTRAGYSKAFKQAWQQMLGTAWRAPDSDIDARWQSETLKSALETRIVNDCLTEAQRRDPNVQRMVAIHSEINYAGWGIATPHAQMLRLPALQGIIGQVWTGTARWPVRSAGVRAERTFDLGYLEYSSLDQLVRGSGKRLWFLMDPVEDSPDRTMQDYQYNYLQTLAASLMFPDVSCFEVMPWPERVYGRVPGPYATIVNTVVGTLDDLWRYPSGTVSAGSATAGTFVADSMCCQRGDPSPSDMDGFFALAMPLVTRGVPLKVLSFDRVADPGYLAGVRLLLLSYDFLKPTDPAQTRALVNWVRGGGALVVVGGTDAYNNLTNSVWRRAGKSTPVEDLLSQLGLSVPKPIVLQGPRDADESPLLTTVLKGDGTVHDQHNRGRYNIDLTNLASATGSVVVRFADATPSDGYGPYLREVALRAGQRLLAAFRPGSEIESHFLWAERDTRFDGEGRFADGGAYWEYRFDNLPRNTPITLTVDLANGFLVSARPARNNALVLSASDADFPQALSRLRLPADATLTLLTPPAGATPLFTVAGSATPPVWRAQAGAGSVTMVGVSPASLSGTSQGARWLFWIARRALEMQHDELHTASAFVARRGPYVVVRTLGRERKLEGRYVDLLAPDLAMRDDPVVPARTVALYQHVRPAGSVPQLLAASGRVRAQVVQPNLTAFLVEAPSQTDGAARVWRGGRTLTRAMAFTTLGAPVDITSEVSGDTVLLHYRNAAEGIVVRLLWK